jgi:hypothetical protein
MKITSIHVSHFLGIEAADIELSTPISLVCGANGAGKSSLKDAVALALTADLGRVGLKKEAPALIREGADLAVCELKTVDGDEYCVTINRSGKITDSFSKRSHDPVLSFVLDAQALARITHTERRAFLYDLMSLKTDGPAIVERLKARGLDGAKITRVEPLLRSGFDAASKDAKEKATQAKGAWKTVTGEAYGSDKAKTWRASVPPFDAKIGAALVTELQHLDVAAEQWQQSIGKLQAEEQRRAALRAKLPGPQEQAARIGRIEVKLATDEQTLAGVAASLKVAEDAHGGAPRVGLVHDLASSLADALHYIPDDAAGRGDACAALDAYERTHGEIGTTDSNPEAAARLPELQHAHQVAASAVANDRRDLDAAKRAKAEADSITAELAEVFDAAALAEAREQAATLKTKRSELVTKIDAQKSIKALVEGAEAKTKAAAGHAADVLDWDALGDALGPNGIPAEILAEALGPINERLAQSAADAGWPTVVISADMAITAAGREYRLLSESEKWRCDAMLAEAVAQISGARLLVIDRFDCLDLQGRADLLAWLDVLADNEEIDTALVFGTLKQPPQGLSALAQAYWVEGGVVGQRAEAA